MQDYAAMAELKDLKTFSDARGHLSVIEAPEIPFTIKRIFYIYGVDRSERGGHRHRKTVQALICLKGSCVVETDDGKMKSSFILDHPRKCLILKPEDWHILHQFEEGAILLVLASELFDVNDYLYEPYS